MTRMHEALHACAASDLLAFRDAVTEPADVLQQLRASWVSGSDPCLAPLWLGVKCLNFQDSGSDGVVLDLSRMNITADAASTGRLLQNKAIVRLLLSQNNLQGAVLGHVSCVSAFASPTPLFRSSHLFACLRSVSMRPRLLWDKAVVVAGPSCFQCASAVCVVCLYCNESCGHTEPGDD